MENWVFLSVHTLPREHINLPGWRRLHTAITKTLGVHNFPFPTCPRLDDSKSSNLTTRGFRKNYLTWRGTIHSLSVIQIHRKKRVVFVLSFSTMQNCSRNPGGLVMVQVSSIVVTFYCGLAPEIQSIYIYDFFMISLWSDLWFIYDFFMIILWFGWLSMIFTYFSRKIQENNDVL